MCEHEKKYCPRCDALFECKVGSILICQCTGVTLNAEEREYMGEQYSDCLCASCMKQVKTEYHIQRQNDKIRKMLGFFGKG